jgi:hypothetical protein
MKARSKLVIALAVASLLCGCATKPPTAQEKVAVWLAERPRAITVGVQPELPQPRVHTRDHQAGKRAGQAAGGGLAGAGYAVLAGCRAIPLFGCVVGLYLAPVGAVVGATVGAVRVNSIDVYHSADAVKDGDTLFEVARRSDLPKLLAEAVVAQQPKAGGHQFRIAENNAPDDQEPGSLRIALHTVQLSGETGDNAAVALVIEARAEMHTPSATAGLRGNYAYAGSPRRVSEWATDDARPFREEIAKAILTIATEIVQDVRSSPSASTVSRVQAARKSGK